MKKIVLIISIVLILAAGNVYAQCSDATTNGSDATSIGMIIYSNDTETVWNAMRFANFSKDRGDTVSIFLLGKGVELDNLVKSSTDIKEQADDFLANGGKILGCGTCLQSRNNNEPQVCKFSSLADLYELVRKNKIVLTF